MVPEYDTMDELWLETVQTMLSDHRCEDESRDGGVAAEQLGFTARLLDPSSNMVFNPLRKWSPWYAAAEVLWYLSGECSIERILPYAPQYERFGDQMRLIVDQEGRECRPSSVGLPAGAREEFRTCAPGAAYGWRWSRLVGDDTQITALIKLLRKNPSSRQAVLNHWDTPFDLKHARDGSLKTIPCTLSLHFLIRDGRLNLSVYMRSNDVWLGLANDAFAFTCLQQLIAAAVGVDVGWYQHHASTMHLYSRDAERAEAAANPPSFTIPDKPHIWTRPNYSHPAYLCEAIEKAVRYEKHHRDTRCVSRHIGDDLRRGSLLHELVVMAGLRWARPRDRYEKLIENDLLRKFIQRVHPVKE